MPSQDQSPLIVSKIPSTNRGEGPRLHVQSSGLGRFCAVSIVVLFVKPALSDQKANLMKCRIRRGEPCLLSSGCLRRIFLAHSSELA
jgi:hypothetical protein